MFRSQPRALSVRRPRAYRPSFELLEVRAVPTVTITNPGNQVNNVGDVVSLALPATADGPIAGFWAFNLPPGLSAVQNGATLFIAGTVGAPMTFGHAPVPYSVSLSAYDSDGTSNPVSFTWTVNGVDHAPVITDVGGDRVSVDGDSVSFQVQGYDPDGDAVSYSATGLPAGVTISAAGAVSGTIAAGASAQGPYAVTVTASDGTLTATAGFQWTVHPQVALAAPADQLNFNADAVSLSMGATDTAGSNRLSYSASNLPPGLAIDPGTGVISGTISNTADGNSPYAVTVTATDSHDPSASVSKTFNWYVTPQLLTVSQGDQFNVVGDSVSVSVNHWNTNNHALAFSAAGLPSGLSIGVGTGVISGTIAGGASTASPYAVTVAAYDSSDGLTASVSFNWYVYPETVNVDAMDTVYANVGSTNSIPTFAADNDGGALTYTASGLPAGMAIDSTTGVISGTYDSSDSTDTPYSVTITATDAKFGMSQTANFSLVLYVPSAGIPYPDLATVTALQTQLSALANQAFAVAVRRGEAEGDVAFDLAGLAGLYGQLAVSTDVTSRAALTAGITQNIANLNQDISTLNAATSALNTLNNQMTAIEALLAFYGARR